MKTPSILSLLGFLLLACAPAIPAASTPSANAVLLESTARPTPGPVATEASPPDAYAIFSINVQDFAYPEKSAEMLNRIIDLHEQYQFPVDVYLTDVIAEIYVAQHPRLLERLRSSSLVAVSYHYRPPRPYGNQYDWLGLGDMNADPLYETLMRYETHAVDPMTGQTTDAPGGYARVAELIGYAPYTASSLTGGEVDNALMRVFRELGAQLTITHGIAINLGDKKDSLYLRPEHFDLRLFEYVNQDAASVFESTLAQAQAEAGANLPTFVGIKMHDNDFFAEQSAWLTVYLDGGKRPNWDPTLKSPLLTQTEQVAMWSLYEQMVIYVASLQGRVGVVNAPLILEMLP